MAKFIQLKPSDGKIYKVNQKIAMKFSPVMSMIELLGDLDDTEILPFDGIDSDIFGIVLEWANHHIDDPIFEEPTSLPFEVVDDEISDWDKQFFKETPEAKLLEILRGCSYLGMNCLADVICKIITNVIFENDCTNLAEIFETESEFPKETMEELVTELKKLKNRVPNNKVKGIYD